MGYKDNYKNMSKSNLTFLNASGDDNHADILASIEKEKQDKIRAIPFTLSASGFSLTGKYSTPIKNKPCKKSYK